ncbi:uncharacterized protein LOC129989192 [Argiope bruennichi]|uniref:Uncharacterized protein n=1 Tax=Argiope bruennichi TaxID=94029 RepID=A0A8T0EDA4_ARGBR|nr:uncharacterized protein LOC129989192 [Argiope bruennichi]KAF8770015.1 hypothetical protein HNY73_017591 [Argiope bruennichi]
MKNLALASLLLVCAVGVRAGKEECRETGMKITEVLRSKVEDGSLPECGQEEAFKNVIMHYGTEEEENRITEFKERYNGATDDEKKEIKECMAELMKVGSEEVKDIPEDCQELIDIFCDELTNGS